MYPFNITLKSAHKWTFLTNNDSKSELMVVRWTIYNNLHIKRVFPNRIFVKRICKKKHKSLTVAGTQSLPFFSMIVYKILVLIWSSNPEIKSLISWSFTGYFKYKLTLWYQYWNESNISCRMIAIIKFICLK